MNKLRKPKKTQAIGIPKHVMQNGVFCTMYIDETGTHVEYRRVDGRIIKTVDRAHSGGDYR